MLGTVEISIAFRGSNPKLLCNERSNPRTATIEEVTSTAQIAICNTSNRSRNVTRAPITPVDPDLTIWYESTFSTWRTGTMPKRIPLASAKIKATA